MSVHVSAFKQEIWNAFSVTANAIDNYLSTMRGRKRVFVFVACSCAEIFVSSWQSRGPVSAGCSMPRL